MRHCSEWDEEYIRDLPRGEFDWIEYKARKALDFSIPGVDENKVLDELSKQISAFANSGGGTLVYGMDDPANLAERSIDDGGISITLKGRNTKEWLEDIIPNLIEYPLRRFNVYLLTNEAGAPSLATGRALILIEVQNSPEAPHQARDKKYYARIGGKSRPIGHRIVADIFNRRNHAEFELTFSLYSETWINNDPFGQPFLNRGSSVCRSVQLCAHAKNTGGVHAQFVKIFVLLPKRIVHPDDINKAPIVINGIEYVEFSEGNQRRDVVGYEMRYPKYGPSWFDPILPGLSRTWKFRCDPALQPSDIDSDLAMWRIHADR